MGQPARLRPREVRGLSTEPKCMGRPARPEARLAGLSVRLQTDVVDELYRRASKARVSVGEYLRTWLPEALGRP